MSNPFYDVVHALESAGQPYAVAGGFAVVMHGSNRFTPDVNVLCGFEGQAIRSFVKTLGDIGLEADGEGMSLEEFLTPETRDERVRSNRRFLWLRHGSGLPLRVSFFGWHPLPFEEIVTKALRIPLVNGRQGGRQVCVVSLDHLEAMKLVAKRPQDVVDLENLEILRQITQIADTHRCSLEEVREKLAGKIEDARLDNLISFLELSADERVEWLGQMLEVMGQFL